MPTENKPATMTGWYDATKLNAAQAAATAAGGSSDGRYVVSGDAMLGAINPITGVRKVADASAGYMKPGERDEWMPETQAEYRGYGDQLFHGVDGSQFGDPSGQYVQWSDNGGVGWQNPTGGEHDRVQPIYKLDASGNATPVSADRKSVV